MHYLSCICQTSGRVVTIGRLKLEENKAPLANQLGPSQKVPKSATKEIESVHMDEVGKTRMRSSKRHEDGGEADN